jgi:hypothetical protein
MPLNLIVGPYTFGIGPDGLCAKVIKLVALTDIDLIY